MHKLLINKDNVGLLWLDTKSNHLGRPCYRIDGSSTWRLGLGYLYRNDRLGEWMFIGSPVGNGVNSRELKDILDIVSKLNMDRRRSR